MELVKEYLPPHVTPITDIFFWATDSCSVAVGLGAAIRPETVPIRRARSFVHWSIRYPLGPTLKVSNLAQTQIRFVFTLDNPGAI
jgi:hypothetical protein